MKKTILFVLLAVAAFSLLGCSAVSKGTTQAFDAIRLVRDEFNSLLPSDFRGPIDLSRSDAYFSINLKASNVHKLESGEWSWDWVEYRRQTHIATWNSDVHFKIGAPKS